MFTVFFYSRSRSGSSWQSWLSVSASLDWHRSASIMPRTMEGCCCWPLHLATPLWLPSLQRGQSVMAKTMLPSWPTSCRESKYHRRKKPSSAEIQIEMCWLQMFYLCGFSFYSLLVIPTLLEEVSVPDCCFVFFKCSCFFSWLLLFTCQTGQLFGASDQDKSSTRSSLSCPHISAKPSIQVCIHILTAIKKFLQ